ncbi:MAG TPA: MFS transporter [Acidimicrobiales bacterium]|nr:MFS transporter [Acidimicrobiales bacterium]
MEQHGDEATTLSEHRHTGLALLVICAVQMMVILDGTIVNIALPSIQRQLHFSSTNLEWVITAYALAFGGLLLLGGRSGDLYGRRRMFTVGVALFTAASLLGGFAQDQVELIAARVLQGVGGAIASPTALALIQNTFPEGPRRSRAMGVYAAMSGAGGSLGLLLGGVLTDVASWRWVLFVNVPIGLVVALTAPRVLGTTPTRRGRLDLPGALSVTLGMVSLVGGLSRAATAGWGDSLTLGALGLAAVLLVTFLVIESASEHALMPLRIFAERRRAGSYAIMLCLAAAMFSTFFFITQFVQNVLGYSPLKAGIAFLPMTVGIGGTATVMSRVVGRIGTRRPMTVGPLIVTAGLLWLSFVSVHSSYVTVLGPLLCLAVGMGSTFVPLTLTVMSRVQHGEAGLASALLNTGQQIGGSLGLAILVTVATSVTRDHVGAGHLAHRVATHAAVTDGYDAAFRIGALIAFGAFVLAVTVIRGPRASASVGAVNPDAQPEAAVA